MGSSLCERPEPRRTFLQAMKASFWKKRRQSKSLRLQTIKKKRERGICLTPNCRKMARKQKRYCNTCRSRMYDNPLKVLFWNLKKSAKRRGKEFALAFEDFKNMAVKSGYDLLHGRGASDLHVDRIDASQGYVPGNVQVITASENTRKSWTDRTGWTPPHLRQSNEPF